MGGTTEGAETEIGRKIVIVGTILRAVSRVVEEAGRRVAGAAVVSVSNGPVTSLAQ
jgi:hypothetical protein